MHINSLSLSTSPYLLQHQNNPVNWFEWGSEALEKARIENKPLIVSIGYSACHWCHVMEHECFENETLAAIMNQNFVCIKVDREERPDIDQIYMDAVQNMGLRGGWPLNVFCIPDGKPFYGGTYFPPAQWQSILGQIANAYQNHYDEILKSADGFKDSLNRSETEKYGLFPDEQQLLISDLEKSFLSLAKNFDSELGGMNRAPKFPMPCVYQFLLNYWKLTGDERALSHTVFTLTRMAEGGIYDQIGGGFARYSTDSQWFVPHFEKMLYDNAQLIRLYSTAYQITSNELFKTVVYESITFISNELANPEGGFYAALDADSEGEEGKFYVWKKSEIDQILGEEAEAFCSYFNILETGNWEHGINIPFVSKTEENSKIKEWKSKLLTERNKRIRPGLDYKIITSWHALMVNALADAYRVFNEAEFLEKAIKGAAFIEKNLKGEHNQMYHTFHQKGKPIIGFLEDYAFVIQAYLNLYEVTFDLKWLQLAKQYMDYALANFSDTEDVFLFFTEKNAEKLIARKKEIFDNVIPASNSVMAVNMYKISHFYADPQLLLQAEEMINKMKKLIIADSNYTANWGVLACAAVGGFKEIVVSGNQAQQALNEINKSYMPFKILALVDKIETLPIFKNRYSEENLKVYICEKNGCQKPMDNLEDLKSI